MNVIQIRVRFKTHVKEPHERIIGDNTDFPAGKGVIKDAHTVNAISGNHKFLTYRADTEEVYDADEDMGFDEEEGGFGGFQR